MILASPNFCRISIMLQQISYKCYLCRIIFFIMQLCKVITAGRALFTYRCRRKTFLLSCKMNAVSGLCCVFLLLPTKEWLSTCKIVAHSRCFCIRESMWRMDSTSPSCCLVLSCTKFSPLNSLFIANFAAPFPLICYANALC